MQNYALLPPLLTWGSEGGLGQYIMPRTCTQIIKGMRPLHPLFPCMIDTLTSWKGFSQCDNSVRVSMDKKKWKRFLPSVRHICEGVDEKEMERVSLIVTIL
jgi:hypothetical protein